MILFLWQKKWAIFWVKGFLQELYVKIYDILYVYIENYLIEVSIITIIIWRQVHKMQPHEELDEAFEEYQKKMEQIKNSRKKNPDDKPATQQQKNVYVPEPKVVPRMKFQDLPEEIQFYLIEIYPFGGKLFITGLMENGQTLNVVANDLYR